MGVFGAFLQTGNFTKDGTAKTVPLETRTMLPLRFVIPRSSV